MNFSISKSLDRWITVWKRFPLTLSAACIFTIIAIITIDKNSGFAEVAMRYIMTLALAVFSLLAAKVIIESHVLKNKGKAITYTIVAIILAIYFWLLPSDFDHRASKCLLWISVGLVLLVHLLISCIPYFRSGRDVISFRSYNHSVLLRFAESVFYSLVLFGSLSLALLALEKLFGFKFNGETYMQLFVFLMGVFNTSYFLYGFPTDYNDQKYGRPKGLKVLAEYIMIPIVCIYGVILYAYVIKVLLSGDWPLPWVKYLVIWFLVLGMFTYLLNYFTENEDRNTWTKIFVKYFFPLAIPVSILLLASVYHEVDKQGLTDELYINGIISIWVIGLAVYILISKKDDIRLIPISLSIVTIFTFLTPINVCTLTVNSQSDSLINSLKADGYIVNDQLVKKENSTHDFNSNIYNQLRYLNDYLKLDLLREYDTNHILPTDDLDEYTVGEAIGITYQARRYGESENEQFIDISPDYMLSYDIGDYQKIIPISYYQGNNIDKTPNMKSEHTLHGQIPMNDHYIRVFDKENLLGEFDISEILNKADRNLKNIEVANDSIAVKLILKYMGIKRSSVESKIENVDGILLYRKLK